MTNSITSLIDRFYPPFRRVMPLQTFRYAACGGGNTLLGLTVYYVAFNFIFARQNFNAGFVVFKPHNAALFLSFVVSFSVGFLLNKYVVFTTSYLRGRIQLLRYFLSFFLNLVVNYLLLMVLVDSWKIDAFIAQLITTTVIITIGYLTQKHFTFRESQK